jgi:hypothetical protein
MRSLEGSNYAPIIQYTVEVISVTILKERN